MKTLSNHILSQILEGYSYDLRYQLQYYLQLSIIAALCSYLVLYYFNSIFYDMGSLNRVFLSSGRDDYFYQLISIHCVFLTALLSIPSIILLEKNDATKPLAWKYFFARPSIYAAWIAIILFSLFIFFVGAVFESAVLVGPQEVVGVYSGNYVFFKDLVRAGMLAFLLNAYAPFPKTIGKRLLFVVLLLLLLKVVFANMQYLLLYIFFPLIGDPFREEWQQLIIYLGGIILLSALLLPLLSRACYGILLYNKEKANLGETTSA